MPGTKPLGGAACCSRYAADTLQIRLLNGDEAQSKGQVTLEASIEKLQISFDAHILNIT